MTKHHNYLTLIDSHSAGVKAKTSRKVKKDHLLMICTTASRLAETALMFTQELINFEILHM